MAHLNPVKDQATLLRAFAVIRQSHDAHLDIAGGDTMGGRLQALARDLGVGDPRLFMVSCHKTPCAHSVARTFTSCPRGTRRQAAVDEAAAAGIATV